MVKTEYFSKVLEQSESDAYYQYLESNIDWKEGIKSRKGFTRLAKALELTDDAVVDKIVTTVIQNLFEKSKNITETMIVHGLYLNYYKNGEHYTPNHSHKGTTQIIVSLGETRTLNIGKKGYEMKNGDVAIFGSAIHGVPKSDTKNGRISIAFFATPVEVELDNGEELEEEELEGIILF